MRQRNSILFLAALLAFAGLTGVNARSAQLEGALQYPPLSVGEDAQPPPPARMVPPRVSPRRIEMGIDVAEAADPTLLAETGAYLLGNAHRCGVADDREEHARTVIRGLIVVAARDAAQLAVAKARFVEIFSAVAVPSQDQDGFPSCKVVIPQFERLERHHRRAGLTD